jgi:hypothetical protein
MRQLLDTYAHSMGWDDASVTAILLAYLERGHAEDAQASDKDRASFHEFLEEQAEVERAMVIDDWADTEEPSATRKVRDFPVASADAACDTTSVGDGIPPFPPPPISDANEDTPLAAGGRPTRPQAGWVACHSNPQTTPGWFRSDMRHPIELRYSEGLTSLCVAGRADPVAMLTVEAGRLFILIYHGDGAGVKPITVDLGRVETLRVEGPGGPDRRTPLEKYDRYGELLALSSTQYNRDCVISDAEVDEMYALSRDPDVKSLLRHRAMLGN